MVKGTYKPIFIQELRMLQHHVITAKVYSSLCPLEVMGCAISLSEVGTGRVISYIRMLKPLCKCSVILFILELSL